MKKRILSLLFVLCLMMPTMTMSVAAAGPDCAVTATKSTLFVGQEFDVVVALPNYADSDTAIRGLQIDVGIDTSLWEVVSCSTVIEDDAEQNKASYHEADGYVRLLYLNLSGTLDKSVTEVLNVRLRLKEDVTSDGSTAFPITVKIATTTENMVLNDLLTVEYNGVMLGDVNKDGKRNNRDIGLMQRYLNGWDADILLSAADVNGDGYVNNRDMGLFQRYLNDWDVELG